MKAISDPTTKTIKHDVYETLTEAVVEMRQEALFRNGSTKLFDLAGKIEIMMNYWLQRGMADTFEEVVED